MRTARDATSNIATAIAANALRDARVGIIATAGVVNIA